ncbi:MAG TPA: N-acetylmuramoyl-L-alanine amidase [Candidatus Nanopelagicaceae bacterium]|nr:N-acetylmuramoyl-L-alanine amidase [Candidatus Nanopelagicaceae bacterium]
MKLGDQGPQIAQLRHNLVLLGLLPESNSDVFDDEVEQAVRSFQQTRGLTVDGLVGEHTFRAIDEAHWRLGDRALSYSASHLLRGDDVAALQNRLLGMGFDVGRIDAIFGPRTARALSEFQRAAGIRDDGTCGPATFSALARLSRTVTGGAPHTLRLEDAIGRAGPSLVGKTVVIDPAGDGTEEVFGISESSIVFDLARRIEGRLFALGASAYLTHGEAAPKEGDVERATFANRSNADLFISLHLDSHQCPEASGVATFYYGNDAHGSHSIVGERFASLVQREICARTELLDCKTHAMTWELLRHTKMPAIRIECGYLTSPADALRLAQPAFRDALAESIVVAIQRLYLPTERDSQTGSLRISDIHRLY